MFAFARACCRPEIAVWSTPEKRSRATDVINILAVNREHPVGGPLLDDVALHELGCSRSIHF